MFNFAILSIFVNDFQNLKNCSVSASEYSIFIIEFMIFLNLILTIIFIETLITTKRSPLILIKLLNLQLKSKIDLCFTLI